MTISAPTTTVTVERTIKATPEQVYRAFTNREELNNWFCNNSFMQAQENGAYLCIWNTEEYTATGIVKSLVEAHGGTINAHSQVGAGTTMQLSFPSAAIPGRHFVAEAL